MYTDRAVLEASHQVAPGVMQCRRDCHRIPRSSTSPSRRSTAAWGSASWPPRLVLQVSCVCPICPVSLVYMSCLSVCPVFVSCLRVLSVCPVCVSCLHVLSACPVCVSCLRVLSVLFCLVSCLVSYNMCPVFITSVSCLCVLSVCPVCVSCLRVLSACSVLFPVLCPIICVLCL